MCPPRTNTPLVMFAEKKSSKIEHKMMTLKNRNYKYVQGTQRASGQMMK